MGDIIRHLQEHITLNVHIQITLQGNEGHWVHTVDSDSEGSESDLSSDLCVDEFVHTEI